MLLECASRMKLIFSALLSVCLSKFTLVCEGTDDTVLEVSVAAGTFTNGNVTNAEVDAYVFNYGEQA